MIWVFLAIWFCGFTYDVFFSLSASSWTSLLLEAEASFPFAIGTFAVILHEKKRHSF